MADTTTAAPSPADGKHVLVTGGSGFVGSWVVRELLTRGYDPVCLLRNPDRLNHKLTGPQLSRIRRVAGDLFDAGALDRAAAGCVAAIHLVGVIEENRFAGQTFSRIHVEGTHNVIAACERAGITRYAHMSALGARPNAPSKYHQTKWFAEERVRRSKLRWTIFRPSVVHGPDGEFMEMMKFFATSRVRQPFMPYFGRGENLLQPVSVRDVAACFVRCLSMTQAEGQVYELGGPERYTWKQLYDICADKIAGKRRLKLGVPVPVAKILARMVMPIAPSVLVPYKFNVSQVQMSQEDSICPTETIEQTFGIQLRNFREELSRYADQIS